MKILSIVSDQAFRAPSVKLVEDATYLLEIPADPRARPDEPPERFVAVHSRGHWFTPGTSPTKTDRSPSR
jgi:hypothetical protein